MAKRAKASTVQADQAPAQTPEERFQHHFPLIKAAKTDVEEKQKAVATANGTYRNLLKNFKKAGGNADMMVELLRLEKLPTADIDRDFRDLNAMLKMANVPVGTQLGLFAPGQTIATAIENEQIGKPGEPFDKGPMSTEDTIRKARDRGYSDGVEGKAAINTYPDGSPEALAFADAWREGQKKLIDGGLGKPRRRGAAADEARPH